MAVLKGNFIGIIGFGLAHVSGYLLFLAWQLLGSHVYLSGFLLSTGNYLWFIKIYGSIQE